jgi:predicted alpha/beta superfamily hydrolase
MYLFKIIIAVVLSLPRLHPQNYSVTFNVQSADSNQIYISGNNPSLGNWNPAAVPLTRTSNNSFEIKLEFKKGDSIQFKFTRGSWSSEAVDKNGTVPGNLFLTVEKDTTLSFNIGYWKDQFEQKFDGQITGNVEYHLNMTGKNIYPRDVIVWLPPGYDSLKEKRYPVLYMHDGQNIIDPATSTFGNDWRIDETADSLIRAGSIKEIIVAGIYNSPARSSEYSKTDTGKAYMEFVVKILKPFIDSVYRTLPDKENTATGGSSLGGLIAFMLVWEYPEIFSKAICLSPAFNYKKINYITEVKESYQKKMVKIYIDNGGVGIEESLQPGIDEMISILLKKGYEKGKDLEWFIDKNAQHNERAWADRFWRPLLFLFKK